MVDACGTFKVMRTEFREGMPYWGGDATGELDALDAKTGKLLWQFRTGSGIHSNPVTYTVNGKQYVAVPTGWGGWMKGFSPELYGATRGSALFVFSLP